MAMVMFDLETLGTRAGCAILSIGAVEFDPASGRLGAEFYTVINRRSCVARGLVEDPSTLAWWSKQSPEAQKVLAEAETAEQGLGGALVAFTGYLGAFGKRDLQVWAMADFDIPILSHCYSLVGYPLPWMYYNGRCYRTLRSLGNVSGPAPVPGVAHNALSDAKAQALQAINILRQLKGMNYEENARSPSAAAV